MMDSNNNMEAPEFVAVILASSVGTRLFPLTSQDHPKHSLPIVGQPMVDRLLHQLVGAGFVRAVLAIHEAEDIFQSFGNHITNSSSSSSTTTGTFFQVDQRLQVLIVRVPTDCPSNIEALRIAVEQVPPTSHIVVLPGDLVVSDVQALKDLVHLHRTSQLTQQCHKWQRHNQVPVPPPPTACTILLTDVGEVSEQGIPLKESAKLKKGLLSREEEEIEYILIEDASSRLLWKQAKIDVEEDKEGVGATPKLELPKARLSSTCTLRMDWNDVHCYCLAPWVRKLLQARTTMLSIQNDLIPLLVSRQFRGIGATFGSNQKDQSLVDEAISMRVRNHHQNPSSTPCSTDDETSYAVLAHVAPNVVFRANTIASYLYANRVEQGRAVPDGASYNARFQSVVLPHCTIGDKVTFKTTVVGTNCRLGNKCRLNNTVLMDNVVIGANCTLQNTIVGSGSEIGDNCSLNDCQLGPGTKLLDGTKKKGEAIVEGDFAAS